VISGFGVSETVAMQMNPTVKNKSRLGSPMPVLGVEVKRGKRVIRLFLNIYF